MPGHLPALVAQSNLVGPVAPQQILALALALPLRNTAQMDALNSGLYNPKDPQFGKYLTPRQFTDQFGPTQADYDAVAAYVRAQGLTVKTTHPNRLVLDIEGTAQAIQTAFGVHLHLYKAPDGRIFRAPDADPILPAAIASRLTGIIGLDTAAVIRKPPVLKPVNPLGFLNPIAPIHPGDPLGLTQFNAPPPAGKSGGSGPGGGFSPSDLRTAYNLNTPLDGSGEVMGLVEFEGYTPSDITAYEDLFSLPHTTLENVVVDNFSDGGGGGECSLDIEMMVAIAPGVNRILVYEAPPNMQGFLDEFSKMATDNRATSISDSWGFSGEPAAFSAAEEPLFIQMKMQGQSFYSASGDDGAYYDGMTLGPTDPSSPNICTVGGTRLFTNGPGGTWLSETTWNGGVTVPFVPQNNGGSGGGISVIWPLPSYQLGLANAANLGSDTHRNMPDVALDADPQSGEFMIVGGIGIVNGGTSAAAPLWAAFTALLNQELTVRGRPRLGFPNPTLYALAAGPTYNQDFHDIADGSTNLFYPAVTGYDLATGLGTLNGLNMINDLASSNIQPPPPPIELLGNGGFENGAKRPQPWVASLSVIDNFRRYPAFSGRWKAWFAGYGSPHTDTLHQTVTIPSRISSARLSYELLVDAQQVLFPVSTLTVQLRDTRGNVLETLDQFTDLDDTLNPFTGRKDYLRHSYDLNVNRYKGKTVQLYVTGVDGNYLPVSFVADVFSLLVQPLAPVIIPGGPPGLPNVAR